MMHFHYAANCKVVYTFASNRNENQTQELMRQAARVHVCVGQSPGLRPQKQFQREGTGQERTEENNSRVGALGHTSSARRAASDACSAHHTSRLTNEQQSPAEGTRAHADGHHAACASVACLKCTAPAAADLRTFTGFRCSPLTCKGRRGWGACGWAQCAGAMQQAPPG